MSNSNLLRAGAIAALLSALTYIVSIVIMFASGSNPSPLGMVLYAASSLLSLVVIVALYMVHRAESALLSLVALIATGAGTVLSLFMASFEISPMFVLTAVLYGGGGLLFGWLGHRSTQMPRGLGLTLMAMGVMSFVMLSAGLAGGGAEAMGVLNLVLTVPYIIWLVWLARHWLKSPAVAMAAA